MQVIPAIDLLDGKVARLEQGEFNRATFWPTDPVELAQTFDRQGAKRLHLVDLDGARKGEPSPALRDLVSKICRTTDLDVQLGGGLRQLKNLFEMFNCGVRRVVLGTVIVENPQLVREALALFGQDAIVAALDVRGTEVRSRAWQKSSGKTIWKALEAASALGIGEVLITDIRRDGIMQGPNVELYREVKCRFPHLRLIASGGVRNANDLRALAKATEFTVVGRALVSGVASYSELSAAVQTAGLSDPVNDRELEIPFTIRVIPCLDVTGGRVVKGVKFQNLRDAGDPVELARFYSEAGADELVFLDITATVEGRKAVFELIEGVGRAVNIPFTIGGGIRSLEDVQRLLEAGADKLSVNSAAVRNPRLLEEMSTLLGCANTVCAVDAKRKDSSWEVLVKGGREETGRDALEWIKEAAERGAGEFLITSFDRDGTGAGFDLELLAAAREKVNVPIIASGGAGSLDSFVEAVTVGGADAVLAASVFHFGKFSIRRVKEALKEAGCPVRI